VAETDFQPLEGQVAVVTGGSRGLGSEIVLAFARGGANVVVASRKFGTCKNFAKFVSESTGRTCVPYSVHVGHWDENTGLVEHTYETFGRLDILVNNAGMAPLYPSLVGVTEELFDKTLSVNLKGPFRLCALAGERMKEAGHGTIINVSSIAAVRPTPKELPYAAAKAGLNTLTCGFALALGPEVRVNGIMAGPFLTDISFTWDMNELYAKSKYYPLRRAGRPGEVASAAMFLANPENSFTTGAIITVDGGVSIAQP
jgi:NAD(P)-dependent dehydrogenase (short-subunit alcohol dehydrogenase family)